MIYRNTDADAIDALERARTGNYGEDDYNETGAEIECYNCGEPIHDGELYAEIGGYYDDILKAEVPKRYWCEKCLKESIKTEIKAVYNI